MSIERKPRRPPPAMSDWSKPEKQLPKRQPVQEAVAPDAVLSETIQDVCTRLGIEDWDLLLIGDGSGQKWGMCSGWACVAMEKDSFERRTFYGGANEGTVNVAELTAYLNPLLWYLDKVKNRIADRSSVRHVHIITDSQLTSNRGNAADPGGGHANAVLWAAFELINRQGIRLHWHHVPRDTVGLNRLCDILSKAGRMLIQGVNTLEQIETQHAINLYNVNPWE